MHIKALARALNQPWFSRPLYQELRVDIDSFVDGMEKYRAYLESQSKRISEAHGSLTFLREPEKDVSICSLPASEATPEAYLQLESLLDDKQPYEPLFVTVLAPPDRYKRRHWFANIQLRCPIMMYRYAHGNNLGTLSFVWKTTDNHGVDQTEVARVITKLNKEQSLYATRDMRHEFLEKYNRLAHTSKAVLRNMYRSLTCDQSAASGGGFKVLFRVHS